MKRTLLCSLFFALCFGRCGSFAAPLSDPIANSAMLVEEADGYVAAEVEHFVKQEEMNVRAWYLTTADSNSGLKPYADLPQREFQRTRAI